MWSIIISCIYANGALIVSPVPAVGFTSSSVKLPLLRWGAPDRMPTSVFGLG